MTEQKVVYVKAGEVMEVERLVDAMTGNGIFLIKRGGGVAIWAKEIVAGDVLLTTEEGRMKFENHSLYADLFAFLRKVRDEKTEDILQWGDLSQYGKVSYAMAKNIAKGFNKHNNLEFRGLNATTIGRICREIGFRFVRLSAGWAVVLEDADFNKVSHLFPSQA